MAPFSAPDPSISLEVRKIAGVVHVRGWACRLSGFSSTSISLAALPVGFRPKVNTASALSVYNNPLVTSAGVSGTSNAIAVKMSEASAEWLALGGSWVADRD